MHEHCIGIALVLHWYCSGVALGPDCDWIGTALVMHWCCTDSALVPLSATRLLHWYCSGTALVLQLYFTRATLVLRNQFASRHVGPRLLEQHLAGLRKVSTSGQRFEPATGALLLAPAFLNRCVPLNRCLPHPLGCPDGCDRSVTARSLLLRSRMRLPLLLDSMGDIEPPATIDSFVAELQLADSVIHPHL